MQRSLLPRSRPSVDGLEVGEVYESSARVDVGGDVYDFLAARRRPARRRARRRHRARRRRDGRHGDGEVRLPLARARASRAGRLPRRRERRHRRRDRGRQVHHDDVPRDRRRPRRGRVRERRASAAAARPPGRQRARASRPTGLVLGIDAGQEYEEVRADLPAGRGDRPLHRRRRSRRGGDGELYGVERLDALLARAPRAAAARARARGRRGLPRASPAASSPTTSRSSSSAAR